jgi:hypothetical protein
MQGYAGSIAATRTRVLVTSPRGGALMLFDAQGRHVATHRRADLSGAASGPTGLTVTDGAGAVWAVDDAGLALLARSETHWDNHLVCLA